MKLSENTLIVWGNMAKTNPHLVIEQGNRVRTVDANCSTLIEYTLDTEEFPHQIAFHDLNGFLRLLKLFDDPDFDFRENKVIISDSSGTTQSYYYSETDDLVYRNGSASNLKYDIEFTVTGEQISKALGASTINLSEDLAFVGEHGDLFLKVLNKEETNPDINLTESKRVFSILIDDTKQYEEFTAFLKHSKKANGKKLNLLPLDEYKVSIAKAGAIKFEGVLDDRTVTYIFALISDSKFN